MLNRIIWLEIYHNCSFLIPHYSLINMIDKNKKKLNPVVQWTKFIIVLVLYLAFLYWVKSWWGLLVVPFIFDI